MNIDNHEQWYQFPTLQSYLWGNYSVDAIRFNPQNSIDGPNKLQLEVNALFKDGGWFDWTLYPDSRTIGMEFTCDSQDGLIMPVAGSINTGGVSAHPVKAVAVHGDPIITAPLGSTGFFAEFSGAPGKIRGIQFTLSA